MPTSISRVATTVPRRYLGQLCKHFEHRLPVTLAESTGRIEFTAGVCTLAAEADALVLRVDAADDAAVATVEDVVARHLLRFAFREPPEIVWTRE
jgi:hypothetical protein